MNILNSKPNRLQAHSLTPKKGLAPQRESQVQEPKDSFTFSPSFSNDEPVSISTLKKIGGGIGLAGVAATALGLATNNPGVAIGGMMSGMVGLTMAYAAHQAG